MSRKAKYILVVILIVFSVLGIMAYRIWNAPPETVDEKQAVSISASELAKQFTADEAKAGQLYLNKAIEVNGIVSGTEQNQDGGLMVILQTDDPMMAVQCAMREQNVKIENGKAVTIKGFYSDKNLFGISLTGCVIK